MSIISDASYLEHEDNIRILGIDPLIPPQFLRQEVLLSDNSKEVISKGRNDVSEVLIGQSDKIVVIVGPCSIHNPDEAIEYAKLLIEERAKHPNLVIIMRAYFEKPRTTVGWKGLINDPDIDGSFNINKGLRLARGLLSQITDLGMPVGCELLDTISPQFLSDCISWGAIGARTTESQLHRELASGVSFPIGFKNGTDGSLNVAVDAMRSASNPHAFLGVTETGLAAIVRTRGNRDLHVILRGGTKGTNYDSASVRAAAAAVAALNPPAPDPAATPTRGNGNITQFRFLPAVMVDASHANSQKDHRNQPKVLSDVSAQLRAGEAGIMGVMIESNLNEGSQKAPMGREGLKRGVSITDACIDWATTQACLTELNAAVQARREKKLIK